MSNDFFFSDDDDPKKDATTIHPFGFSATPEGHSQEEAMVVKPSPVSPKKKATAPPSKRQKGEQRRLLLFRFISPLLLLTK
jgi:hypothetical protein